MGDVIRPYQGYFSVTLPENLKTLINGNILKLRDAVAEFSKFLEMYGETASKVHSPFCNDDDITYWLYYHSLSFSFPDEKLVVGIKTASEKMFREIQQGIVDGNFKIVLRGTAKVSKNNVEGVDKEIKTIKIQKIEGYWKKLLHSSSPDVRRIVDTNDVDDENEKIVNGFLNGVEGQFENKLKVIKISDLQGCPYRHSEENEDEYERNDLKSWYDKWNEDDVNNIIEYIKNKRYLDKKDF